MGLEVKRARCQRLRVRTGETLTRTHFVPHTAEHGLDKPRGLGVRTRERLGEANGATTRAVDPKHVHGAVRCRACDDVGPCAAGQRTTIWDGRPVPGPRLLREHRESLQQAHARDRRAHIEMGERLGAVPSPCAQRAVGGAADDERAVCVEGSHPVAMTPKARGSRAVSNTPRSYLAVPRAADEKALAVAMPRAAATRAREAQRLHRPRVRARERARGVAAVRPVGARAHGCTEARA